jgi:hypothetical protein
MDAAQALHSFWSSFGLKAVDERSAYDQSTLDALGIGSNYISYEVAIGEFDQPVALTASLWDRSTSWSTVEQQAKEIYSAIGRGGVKINYDGGQVWITRGNPFSMRADSGSIDMKRIYLNITAEFQTAD